MVTGYIVLVGAILFLTLGIVVYINCYINNVKLFLRRLRMMSRGPVSYRSLTGRRKPLWVKKKKIFSSLPFRVGRYKTFAVLITSISKSF